jgi:antitoxin (DNA-binding transcriptional repressor) of toxin-antitoxin stability system
MRQLGKLTAEQVEHIAEPVPVTNHGRLIAWLVPLNPAERHRAELVATGRLQPGRPEGLTGWRPLPPRTDGTTLTEALLELRERERK